MDVTVTFVGNATTLITAGGLTLLIDPNFLHRKGLDRGFPIVATPHAAKRLHHRGFPHALPRLPAGRRLPLGLTVTMDGRQRAELVAMLTLPKAIPVQFDDYGVFASPLADFTPAP